jgi:hypothetical protein
VKNICAGYKKKKCFFVSTKVHTKVDRNAMTDLLFLVAMKICCSWAKETTF